MSPRRAAITTSTTNKLERTKCKIFKYPHYTNYSMMWSTWYSSDSDLGTCGKLSSYTLSSLLEVINI